MLFIFSYNKDNKTYKKIPQTTDQSSQPQMTPISKPASNPAIILGVKGSLQNSGTMYSGVEKSQRGRRPIVRVKAQNVPTPSFNFLFVCLFIYSKVNLQLWANGIAVSH